MRYTSTINNLKCVEWDLSLSQAFLVDLLVYAPHWADKVSIGNSTYYWISRNKVLDEIPHVFKTADTVYRALKALAEKGIIDYRKSGKKDIVRVTNKGKEWIFKSLPVADEKLGKKINLESDLDVNSEINPKKLGYKSEYKSELNPIDNGYNINNCTNHSTRTRTSNFVKPTLEQVKDYFSERGHPNATVEAERWFDHYTANGWKVGRNSMKDWKAAIRNWIRNDKTVNQGNNNANNQSANQTANKPASHFDQLRHELELKYGSGGYTDSGIKIVN